MVFLPSLPPSLSLSERLGFLVQYWHPCRLFVAFQKITYSLILEKYAIMKRRKELLRLKNGRRKRQFQRNILQASDSPSQPLCFFHGELAMPEGLTVVIVSQVMCRFDFWILIAERFFFLSFLSLAIQKETQNVMTWKMLMK